jgi:hypothetical protein
MEFGLVNEELGLNAFVCFGDDARGAFMRFSERCVVKIIVFGWAPDPLH